MASLLFMTLAAGVGPARAIPAEQALRKLAPITVYVITDGGGQPLPIPRGKTLVLPLYLDPQRVRAEVSNVSRANPGLKAQALPLPLPVANDRVRAMRGQLKEGYTLVAPFVPYRSDLDQAAAILRRQGLDDKRIRSGLTLPIFYALPPLLSSRAEGQRRLLFLRYDDLQRALSRLPAKGRPQPQVADITAILRDIAAAPSDLYVFAPPGADTPAPAKAAPAAAAPGGQPRPPARAPLPPPPPPLP
jgi:hypothetical protein